MPFEIESVDASEFAALDAMMRAVEAKQASSSGNANATHGANAHALARAGGGQQHQPRAPHPNHPSPHARHHHGPGPSPPWQQQQRPRSRDGGGPSGPPPCSATATAPPPRPGDRAALPLFANAPPGGPASSNPSFTRVDAANYDKVRAGPMPPPPRNALVELHLEKNVRRVSIHTPRGFDELVVAAIKRVPGREYDAATRRWNFPESHLKDAAAALKSAPGVCIEVVMPVPIVQRALAVMTQLERAAAAAAATSDGGGDLGDLGVEAAYERIPETLRDAMFPFQREGVKFGLARGGRVLIGDQMGLGKTIQALALVSCYPEDWPCLVLVPTSLRDAWESALRRWLGVRPSLIAAVASGADGNKINGAAFAIVPYSLVGKLGEKLARKKYQIVVCDESHFLKDGKAQRTKAVVPLIKAARRAICLTGTPALSRPIELYTQLEALRPNVFTKFNEFAQRYCSGSRFGWQGCTNADELFGVISRLVMVRRLKKDVLTQLPPKTREQVFLPLPKSEALSEVKAIRERLNDIKESNRDEGVMHGGEAAGSGAPGRTLEEKRLMNQLYVASAKAKIGPVQEYLETLIDGGADKFLFFAHHAELLDAAAATLKKRKIQHIRIDGSTPSTARGKLVETFQTVDAVRVAVLSIKAAGVGLTLTAASAVIFGELSWTPGEIVQAEDRAHRIGQVNSVSVQFLCARNTVDDIMWGSVQNKLENLGQVLDGTSGDCLDLANGKDGRGGFATGNGAAKTPASAPKPPKRTYGDRSPGGGPLARMTNDSNTPRAQSTLDAFVKSASKEKEKPSSRSPSRSQPRASQGGWQMPQLPSQDGEVWEPWPPPETKRPRTDG